MTFQLELEKILESYDTWCLCDCDECQKSDNFKQATQAITTLVLETLGEYEADETDKWTPEVASDLALARRVVYGRNCLLSELRTKFTNPKKEEL